MSTAFLFVLACFERFLCVSAAAAEAACEAQAGCAGTAQGNLLLQFTGKLDKDTHDLANARASCNETSWPDLDDGRTCGACKVLVDNFESKYGTCDRYCQSISRRCVGAWEEQYDTCNVLYDMTCDQTVKSSDALCECSAELIEKDEKNTRASCDETSWPDLDHDRTCGDCKVLVNNFDWKYGTCNGYCQSIGRKCVGAWEEQDDTCNVLYDMTCDQTIKSSDALCQCSVELFQEQEVFQEQGENGHDCYGHLSHVAEDEGNSVGSTIRTRSATKCQEECNEHSSCNSFTLCPGWRTCFMKDRSFNGNERTKVKSDCKTYYKKSNCTTSTAPRPSPAGPPGRKITVMSYNTEYRNYNARMGGYARKIRDVAPAIVGLQECQNRDGLARLAGYTANKETGRQNYMLFDPNKVTFIRGGNMRILRDNYAPRAITWGVFKLGDVEFYFFNTHLPHNHNEAASRSSHAKIAKQFLNKRRELGAENKPTIVVGDMNSHASNFNRHHTGGFESNLRDNGFVWAYTAKGNPGYPRIDHILYSAGHWTHSNCRDTGTGGSDHTSITCDLRLTSR